MISLYYYLGNNITLIIERMFGIISIEILFGFKNNDQGAGEDISMNIFLSQKELEILKNYVEEMLRLFEESDMVKEDETLYLSGERLEVSKKDFKALKKKL